ncbi:MAG: hypothetical protein CMJ83_01010 [Planctomycetes bacterium]|nr:hypothetical protein [Planctomycetota bacterium]
MSTSNAASTPSRRPLIAVLVVVAIAGSIGIGMASCGDSGEEMEWPSRTVKEPTSEQLAQGSPVGGLVLYSGKTPKRPGINMGADHYCKASHQNPVATERIVVETVDGRLRLRDVFVHVTKGLEEFTFEWVKDELVIDQQGCVYVPHVAGVRLRQPVKFLNSDATSHNVNTAKASKQGFNKTTPTKGSSYHWQFRTEELDILAKCDIHPWMQAWLHVVDHPYFAVTSPNGSWAFPKPLPPGTYTIEARHADLGTQTREVTVEAGKPLPPLEFRFKK